jgi:hypothetical protein
LTFESVYLEPISKLDLLSSFYLEEIIGPGYKVRSHGRWRPSYDVTYCRLGNR